MSSELKVDTVSEKTTDNGIAVDSFKLKISISLLKKSYDYYT